MYEFLVTTSLILLSLGWITSIHLCVKVFNKKGCRGTLFEWFLCTFPVTSYILAIRFISTGDYKVKWFTNGVTLRDLWNKRDSNNKKQKEKCI